MTLLETIKQLPQSAGIYQYFDKNGVLLYIGKAKNLSNRVKSYWQFKPTLQANSTLSSRIKRMIEQTTALNYIVVKSEHDALILENSLIKQLNPKYNILLRDDKTYPYIYIDMSLEFPRFEITRKVLKKSHSVHYYGPYSVGAKDILDSIYEICQLVQKKGSLKSAKLCLYHQINKCLGPCELPISKERYEKEIQKATSLIKNKKQLLIELQTKMEIYAASMRFEEAAELRDRIGRIGRSEIKSDIDFATDENYDIFVVQSASKRAVVVRIFMRNGKIISSSHDLISIDENFCEDELQFRTLLAYYKEEKPPIVAPILLAKEIASQELMEQHLSSVFEKKANILIPKRGKKKDLIKLALLNATELLKKDTKNDLHKTPEALQELCSLNSFPSRVEIFDNSHMSGMATVGAMVVYEDGKFIKNAYRTYHLQAKDEYAQMRETLTRRVNSFEKAPPPDLWILDGGATLLKLAHEILNSYGITLDTIAISKEKVDAKAHRAKGKANDIIYTKEQLFRLKNSDKRLQWVQNLRDEAHKAAINFHKKTKLKLDKESHLLTLNGISTAKIKKLLAHFGTFEEIKKVTFEEIRMVLNEKDAKTIKKFYS